jgi:hypothetical protein
MSGQWFVQRGDQARGPFTAERLKGLADQGKLKPTDEVREAESDDWVRASSVNWLFPATGGNTPATDESRASRDDQPAESPGDPVGDESKPPSKKALLIGGGILASVMLMGCCVCAGVSSLFRGGGKLTEDYYPHKPGAMATYEVVMLESENSGSVIEYRYVFLPDRATDRQVARMGTYQNGQAKWTASSTSSEAIRRMNQKSAVIRHRKSQEFIEESDEDGRWTPLIKLNAKPGEQWEAKPLAGVVVRYTLVKFDKCTVDDSQRPCAVVREELVMDGKPNTESEITYAKGIGLYAKQVYDVSGGGRKLVSRWRLVEVPKDRRIEAEKAFYK